jgi:membrane protein
VWRFAGLTVSFVLATGAFAVLYRTIPDARIAWGFIWPGALLAAALFALGKLALGFYVGTYGAPSVDATAAALIVVLLWANYSSHVFFFGAELAEACAAHFGDGVEPEEHAERIEV